MKRQFQILKSKRRGSLYVAVVLVGALVSMIGLSALALTRITGRKQSGIADASAARVNAHAAVRMAMLEIENDPDWRFTHLTDTWFSNVELGGGTFSLTVSDPSDGDVADAPADPLILTGTGVSGDAVHRTQITLVPLHRGYDCLKSAIHAADDVRFYNSVATIDHTVSANDDIWSSYSTVNADIQAADNVSGSTFTQSTESHAEVLTVPASSDVLNWYEQNGTWIDEANLPREFADVIRNGEFDNGTEHWSALDADLATELLTPYSGLNNLSVSRRKDELSGVGQDVTHLIQSGRKYNIRLALKCGRAQSFYVHIEVEDEDGPGDHVSDPITVNAGQWTYKTVQITPWFTNLTSARIIVNTSPNSTFSTTVSLGTTPADFDIDAVTMRENGAIRCLDQVLLSPSHNPFGEPDPRGIYLINMNSNRLVVKNSRIYGTLVLIDPSSNTELGDGAGLVMSPAVNGLPALLVTGNSFYINPGDTSLVEPAMQVNFNDVGAPHATAGEDSDMEDTFASEISGLIYTSSRVRISNLKMSGVIISEHDVYLDGDITMTWDNTYYRNPPPGFSGPEEVRLLLGSAKRVAD